MADNITIPRGTSRTLNVTLEDSVGDPIDISGWIAYFAVKCVTDVDITDSKAVIDKEIDLTGDFSSGAYSIPITDTDTLIDFGDYLWSIKYKRADDTFIAGSVGQGVHQGRRRRRSRRELHGRGPPHPRHDRSPTAALPALRRCCLEGANPKGLCL